MALNIDSSQLDHTFIELNYLRLAVKKADTLNFAKGHRPPNFWNITIYTSRLMLVFMYSKELTKY